MRESYKMVLLLTPHGKTKWKTVKKFTVRTSYGTFSVPKNTSTDLASTPRLLWPWFPPFGKYTQASVIHDRLCVTKEVDRKIADKVFYELMIRYGTSKWKAKIMYFAVRCFSWVTHK